MTKKTEDWVAELYSKIAKLQFDTAQALISQELQIKETDQLLDIGCGDGAVTASLAARVPRGKITAIDFSPDMIRHATEAHKQYNNLQFQVQSAEDIDYENQFDLVVSFSALQWVKHLDNVISGVYRSLKKGGKSLLFFYPSLFFYNEQWQAVGRQAKWREHFKNYHDGFNFYDADGLRILLEQNNFNIQRVGSVCRQWHYDSLSEYRLFIEPINPYVRHLQDPVLKQEYLDNVCAEILRYIHVNADGSFDLPFRTVECVVVK